MTATTASLDRATLASRLLRWPGELAAAERRVLDTARCAIEMRTAHDNTAALRTRDGLPGKNAEERDAHLRLLLCEVRDALRLAEEAQREAASQLRVVSEEGRALMAVARLLGASDG